MAVFFFLLGLEIKREQLEGELSDPRQVALPAVAAWGAMFGASVLCGIGFTMSLFIAGLVFEGPGSDYVVQMRLGILFGSLASAVLGFALLHVMLPRAATTR